MMQTSHTRCRTILLALLLCTLAGIAAAIDLPSIAVDKIEDDFGDVYVGRKVEKTFVVSNNGTAPLAIEYIETTCGCTKAAAASSKVAPGDNTEILVSYDTTDLAAGKTTQAVKINTNDPKHRVVSIRLFANILHDVVLEPQSLVTKLAEVKNPVSFSLVAKNTSDKPVVLQLAKTRGAIDKAVLQPELLQIEPKTEKRFSIEVFLSDQDKRGFYRGAVFFATNHPTETEIVLPCLVRIARKR